MLLCIYLLARPPPGGRLGMFSVAMLLRTDTRSGTPASPQFPSSSACKHKDGKVFVRGYAVNQGYSLIKEKFWAEKLFKQGGKKSDTPLLAICSSTVQQTDFKCVYYLNNVSFVLVMYTVSEHSMWFHLTFLKTFFKQALKTCSVGI